MLAEYNIANAPATTGSTTIDQSDGIVINEAPLESLQNEVNESVQGGVAVFKIGEWRS